MIRYKSPEVTLHHGDCLDVLATLPDCSVDAVVTDPPYGLEFMGKEWDRFGAVTEAASEGADVSHPFHDGTQRVRFGNGRAATTAFGDWCELWAAECLRVLKPGGHLLAFGGTRTWHRLACAVEDAGFEIRDSIAWMYGSGFPKSLDVSKAIDKAAGAEREVVGSKLGRPGMSRDGSNQRSGFDSAFGGQASGIMPSDITAPATDDARTWQGWGTALKPAFEPVVVARKPLSGTVAGNVLAWGTGALNVDGCRVGMSDADRQRINGMGGFGRAGWTRPDGTLGTVYEGTADGSLASTDAKAHDSGRWPANVILDEDQAAALDEQSGELTSGANPEIRGGDTDSRNVYGGFTDGRNEQPRRGTDVGGASRFFYVAKADASERPKVGSVMHPTVKPLSLMRWLVRLVTPPGGTVLEPFAGSGTTVEACLLEGFRCIAIEKGDEYLPLIEARIHRRRDPVAAHKLAGDDEDNLFDLLDDEQGANA